MVDVNEDAQAVTMKILRETRVAREHAEAERAATQSGELQLPPPVPGVSRPRPGELESHVEVPAGPVRARPVDGEAAYRRARLGVVAAIVLVLMLVWLVQRRASASRAA